MQSRRTASSLVSRLTAFTGALALATLAALTPASAAVGSGGGCKYSRGITTYYSSSSYSTVVGTYFSGCNGGCNGSGQITAYWRFESFSCAD
jgi:hypothetical protein